MFTFRDNFLQKSFIFLFGRLSTHHSWPTIAVALATRSVSGAVCEVHEHKHVDHHPNHGGQKNHFAVLHPHPTRRHDGRLTMKRSMSPTFAYSCIRCEASNESNYCLFLYPLSISSPALMNLISAHVTLPTFHHLAFLSYYLPILLLFFVPLSRLAKELR